MNIQYRPGNTYPSTWPVRQTKCGEHPGVYGDNPLWRRMQDAR